MAWKNISLNISTHYLWLLGLCMIFIEVFSCLFVSLKFSAWHMGLCKHKWWKDMYHIYIHIYIHAYIHMHTYTYTIYVYRYSMQKIWEIKTHIYTHIFIYLNAHIQTYESWTIKKSAEELMRSNGGAGRVPWTARRSNQSILKEINPEYSLEGLILKLKLQYFSHLMQRINSLEKTQILGMIEGKEKRVAEDEIDRVTDSMDMSLSKCWETVEDRGAWGAAVHGVVELDTT